MTQKITEELADDGVASGIEAEPESTEVPEPFDPASISLSSKVVALDTVLRRIRNGTIKLAPDFQRNYVWNIERKSLLIESMMLRIPLPMFYVSEDREGVWEVVDGLQRLTTIRDFLLGPDSDGKGISLKGLEFWGDQFDGKTFFAIENKMNASRIINNIMEAELSFTIINPDTPEKVKRNIFKRINTGGMRLSTQEIRHALYQGKATLLLKDMVLSGAYVRIVSKTVKDNRMAGRELILRFISFHLRGWTQFRGDMDTFLSDTMRHINGEIGLETKFSYDSIRVSDDFRTGLMRSNSIFGEHAFRRSFQGQRKTPINKSLFDVWMWRLCNMPQDAAGFLIQRKILLLEKFKELIDSDGEFIDAIGRYGGDVRGVQNRYRKVTNLVREVLDDK